MCPSLCQTRSPALGTTVVRKDPAPSLDNEDKEWCGVMTYPVAVATGECNFAWDDVVNRNLGDFADWLDGFEIDSLLEDVELVASLGDKGDNIVCGTLVVFENVLTYLALTCLSCEMAFADPELCPP